MAKTSAQRQAEYRQRKSTEDELHIYLLPGIKARLKALADRNGVTLPELIRQLVIAAEPQAVPKPPPKMSLDEKRLNSEKADELIRSAGHDSKQARVLLKEYMQTISPGFKTNESGTHASRIYKGISDRIRYLNRD